MAGTTLAALMGECSRRFHAAAGRPFTKDDRAGVRAEVDRHRAVQARLVELRKLVERLEGIAEELDLAGLRAATQAVRDAVRVPTMRVGNRQVERALLVSILGSFPLLGARWADAAALKMPERLAVVSFLCGYAEQPNPRQLRESSPAQIIDREATTMRKHVRKWAKEKGERVKLARDLARRGIRDGDELEGLLARSIWAAGA